MDGAHEGYAINVREKGGCVGMNETVSCLEMRGIYKSFPGVKALQEVSFDVKRGEIHALVGENGAGKSTLMKIITGQYQPDKGRMFFEGQEARIRSMADALKLGISMIQQELAPLMDMTVTENLFIGRELKKKGVLDKKRMNGIAQGYLDQFDLNVSPTQKVRELNIAQMQMLEIIKAVTYNSKLVIMDEPTSSLTDDEVRVLFKTMRELKERGVAIVFISHRLEEVFEIADSITVLRDGCSIDSRPIDGLTRGEIVSMMVGRSMDTVFPKTDVEIGENVLEVKGLTLKGSFKDISFELKKGEILGFAGLVGAGRSEVMRAIFGLDRPDSGEIILEGKRVKIKTPKTAIKLGIGFVSEDRKGDGLILMRSILENISLPTLSKFNRALVLKKKNEKKRCGEYFEKLSVKAPSMSAVVNSLSGGNQQKVVIAKWLLAFPKILILDEPTRGIDVGAKAEIHKLMCALAGQGMAIILISSEMPEVMAMSDRLAVMSEGEIKCIYDKNELRLGSLTQENILNVALGGR